MKQALQAWLQTAARSNDRVAACRAAAEAVAPDPWDVVQQAGRLARATMRPAPHDLGLTPELRVRSPNSPSVTARVPAGAPYPALDLGGRRLRGAFDTPARMAHAAVAQARAAHEGPALSGLDPACGTGAFLVALAQQGVQDITGVDLDPAAIAVAQVAAPRAQLRQGDGLQVGATADLIVGNPPYVPPERQDKAQRAALKDRFPWLTGRFDLSVPFAASAVQRAHPGGVVALVLPAPVMVQPYAAPLRRQWISRHKIHAISAPTHFPGASVQVVTVVLTVGAGPAPLPDWGLSPEELLSLHQAPLNPELQPGDPAMVARIRAASVTVGDLAEVDTGVVSHGPGGGKSRLISDTAAPGRVPYVDARDLAAGRTRWLNYQPALMHRPKRPELFTSPKVLVQRLRGHGPVQAWVDRDGLYAGHTLTVVRPEGIAPERIHRVLTHPFVDAILRIERGQRLDLYPRDVREMPVPKAWLEDPDLSLEAAWDLSTAEVLRLRQFCR